MKRSLQALWVRGSWPCFLEAARASSVPERRGSPSLVLNWQQQERSSFSEGSHAFPNDPGRCPHKTQKLPKQNWDCCTSCCLCCCLSELCSWTSRRSMHFIQDTLIKPQGAEPGIPQSCLMTWLKNQISSCLFFHCPHKVWGFVFTVSSGRKRRVPAYVFS